MRRRPADPERTRAVLMFCAAVALAFALLLAVWAALTATVLPVVVAVVLVGLAIACVRLGQDDGRGTWCPECVARNPEDANTCEACGALLG